MSLNLHEILDALEKEQDAGKKPVVCIIGSVDVTKKLYVLSLKTGDIMLSFFTERLEGNTAIWGVSVDGGKISKLGKGKISTILKDEVKLSISLVAGAPPKVGQTLIVFQPDYLKSVLKMWDLFSPGNSVDKISAWEKSAMERPIGKLAVIEPIPAFSNLRAKQKECLQLMGERLSNIVGPPGTGKTFTLGALVAQALIQNRKNKILILAVSNNSVDEILIAVDKKLEQAGAQNLRVQCARSGKRFNALAYDGREHLLPIEHSIVRELKEHDLKKSTLNSSDFDGLFTWQAQRSELLDKIAIDFSDLVSNKSVVAATLASAYWHIEELASVNWDLIVFDEAGQISLPVFLGLARFGDSVLYAGDPRQLPPVVVSGTKNAKDWLGRTPFDHFEGVVSSVYLDEQSRMAPAICNVISHAFYEGVLDCAPECLEDPIWLADRGLESRTDNEGVKGVVVNGEAAWYDGRIRDASSKAIVHWLKENQKQPWMDELIILTPYHSQRAWIQRDLKNAGLKEYTVGTVHSFQGKECKTVLFDPVDLSDKFLDSDSGQRLINVACSRAKARLVIFLNINDIIKRVGTKNEKFIYLIAHDKSKIPLSLAIIDGTAIIARLLSSVDYMFWNNLILFYQDHEMHFSENLVGKLISINDRKFTFRDHDTGEPRTVDIDKLRSNGNAGSFDINLWSTDFEFRELEKRTWRRYVTKKGDLIL